MRTYCKNCSHLYSFLRKTCKARVLSDFETSSRKELNHNNDCPFYKKTWWKFWVADLHKEIM